MFRSESLTLIIYSKYWATVTVRVIILAKCKKFQKCKFWPNCSFCVQFHLQGLMSGYPILHLELSPVEKMKTNRSLSLLTSWPEVLIVCWGFEKKIIANYFCTNFAQNIMKILFLVFKISWQLTCQFLKFPYFLLHASLKKIPSHSLAFSWTGSCMIFLPSFSPVLRIDNQQNFKIMKILILLKSFISLFYIIRYILRSMI